jgi:hypothetical protein
MRNVVMLCTGLLLAGLAGCATARGAASSGAPASAAAAGPQGAQAEAVADQEFGLLAAGDWPGAWKLWTESAKHVLAEAAFVKLNTECKPRLGVPYVIWQAQRTGTTTVVVRWTRGTARGSNAMLYQQGAWRFAPSAADLAGYRQGVASLVARLKAEKACH